MIPNDLRHFTPNQFKAPSTAVDTRLCYALDDLREDVGAPIHLNCTYASGGHAAASRHKRSPCDAADLVVRGSTPAAIVRHVLAGPWGGVGWYPHWHTPGYHLDLRPGPRVFWVCTDDGYVYGLPVLLRAVGLTLADVEASGPAPSAAFRAAHAFTAMIEGGWTVDKGGATKYGISLRFMRAQGVSLGDIDHDGDVDIDDIRALTPDDAQRLMRLVFWDGLKGDLLPRITAASLYDFAVNAGPRAAVKSLQMACNFYPGTALRIDGILGNKTRAAVSRIVDSDQADMILARRVTQSRRAFYRGLFAADATNPINGWLNRCTALDVYCDRLAGGTKAVAA
jgi:lysozyme family protein